jgi:hypothetical protein
VAGPPVKHGFRAGANQFQKLFAGDWLQSIELVEIAPDNRVDLGNVVLSRT